MIARPLFLVFAEKLLLEGHGKKSPTKSEECTRTEPRKVWATAGREAASRRSRGTGQQRRAGAALGAESAGMAGLAALGLVARAPLLGRSLELPFPCGLASVALHSSPSLARPPLPASRAPCSPCPPLLPCAPAAPARGLPACLRSAAYLEVLQIYNCVVFTFVVYKCVVHLGR